jgi:hypothetical protein
MQAMESSFRRCDQLSGSSGSREGVGTAIIDVADVSLMVPGVLCTSNMMDFFFSAQLGSSAETLSKSLDLVKTEPDFIERMPIRLSRTNVAELAEVIDDWPLKIQSVPYNDTGRLFSQVHSHGIVQLYRSVS